MSAFSLPAILVSLHSRVKMLEKLFEFIPRTCMSRPDELTKDTIILNKNKMEDCKITKVKVDVSVKLICLSSWFRCVCVRMRSFFEFELEFRGRGINYLETVSR